MKKIALDRFNYDNFYLFDAMPMFKLACIFIPSLILAEYVTPKPLLILSLLLVSFLFYMIIKKKKSIPLLQKVKLLNASTITIIICSAFILHYFHVGRKQIAAIQLPINSEASIVGSVESEAVKTKSGSAFNLSIHQIRSDSLIFLEPILIRLFVKNDTAFSLQYGDIIAFNGILQHLPKPFNPGEFDYGSYLKKENIFAISYTEINAISIIEKAKIKDLRYFALSLRDYLEGLLKSGGLQSDELGIADALLLGKRSEISKELLNAFSAAGTVHILAVSGLHVGMLYAVLLFLLTPLKRKKWILLFITLFVLWIYAFITGLSPSVMRATVMFSFMAFGSVISRKAHVINTLSASAIFLLLFDPNLIYKVGFQLSYLAVLGIVTLQPYMANLIIPRYKILNYVWQLITVSIAAQIATAPVGLFYFHQFPNYFILANVFAIPLAFLIVMTGLLVFATSPVLAVMQFLTSALFYLIKGLNFFISWISSLPYSLSSGIYFDINFAVLSYLLLILIFAALSTGKWKFAIQALLVCNIFLLITSPLFFKPKAPSFYIFHDRETLLIGYNEGNTLNWSSFENLNEGMPSQIELLSMTQFPNVNEMHLVKRAESGYKSLTLNNTAIIVITKEAQALECAENLNADICVMAGESELNMKDFTNCFTCKEWIFTANNSYRFINKKSKELLSLGFPPSSLYNIKTAGYYQKKL